MSRHSFVVNQLKVGLPNKQFHIIFLADRLLFVNNHLSRLAALEEYEGDIHIKNENLGEDLYERLMRKEVIIADVLRSDESNFEVLYCDIYRVKLEKQLWWKPSAWHRAGSIIIHKRQNELKLDIVETQDFRTCEQIVKDNLTGKLKK